MKQSFYDLMEAVRSCDVDMPTYMSPNNFDEAMAEFFRNSDLRTPNFTYDSYDFTEKRLKLEEIREAIRNGTVADYGLEAAQSNLLCKYASEVHAKLADLHLIQAYREAKQSGASKEELIGIRTHIEDFNKILNGLPDEKLYRQLINDPSLKGVGFVPDPVVVQRFGALLEQRWGKSLSRIDNTKTEYTTEEVCDLANTVLKEDFDFETDFRAVIDLKKKGMNVNQLEHVLELPAIRANGPYKPKIIRKKVLGHEMFGHLYRAACIIYLGFQELAMLLPGYEIFEEGVTKCIEQALGDGYSINDPADHYVVCGAALHDGLDFRATLEKLNEYRKAKEPDKEVTDRKMTARFQRVTRAFRGTGEIPWTATTIYLDGPRKVWPLITALIDQPEKLWKLLFESGKTDPTLASHQELLKCYGWTDDDFRFNP